ncbi:unnamed protein product [Caenorhabditis auriculariae]|uniref:RNA helicase n=1 Tax=Caenorhabditis auriculariae TaxID=2777116 RepID=A0A8S1HV70_9PELO|nr:unnamed protein product [Caenorhabditis auriculariae]
MRLRLSEFLKHVKFVSILTKDVRKLREYERSSRSKTEVSNDKTWVLTGESFLSLPTSSLKDIVKEDMQSVEKSIKEMNDLLKKDVNELFNTGKAKEFSRPRKTMGDTDVNSIKGFLYGWLGRNKHNTPNYEIKNENRGHVSRFKCELRVDGFPYTAFGNSTNKKDAGTNAAMDFCQYLVREGHMKASEIPSLNASALETARESGFSATSGGGSFFESKAESNSFAPPENNMLPWQSAYRKDDVSHKQYVAQKAEEIAQSENADMKADLHGGWNMDNSKAALNEYLQKMRQPPINYVTQTKEANRTFVTEAALFVTALKRNVMGRGQGSTKKVAESSCAMNIVRQLFHFNIIQSFTGPRKKTAANTLPEIPVNMHDELKVRLREFVRNSGVELPLISEETATPEAPVSIIVDQKLHNFPESTISAPSNVSWAPPMQNWNPWRAANIDEPPLAFMPLGEISEMINQKEAEKIEMLEHMNEGRRKLPVFQYKEQIINLVNNNSVVLIKGETGCGKSTQVAQFLLESYIETNRGAEFNAVVSQPRRISAISLAERISNERGENLGETVGYGVRFDSVPPRPYGSIMFCTVGVLLRMMQNGLRGISHVIIDEIHERDVDTDFVLIVLRQMLTAYKGLRVILMSATIETKLFTDYFGDCPVITMHGRTFPVEHLFLEDIVGKLRFMPEPSDRRRRKEEEEGDEEVDDKGRNMNMLAADAPPQLKLAMSRIPETEIFLPLIEAILKDIADKGTEGAVLIFMPGWAEIVSLMNHLKASQEFSNVSKYEVLPLHSQLTSAEQRRVFNHYENKRKIIISTNIAETSITIDDVVFVIDSCKAKERMYTSNNNMVHFATVWASRTNIVQRRGRAGRVQPGFAFHLCSKQRFESLDEHATPEMLRTPLHQISLLIKLLRLGSVGDFLGKALEPPPYDMVVESEAMLQSMGALDKNLELTSLGRMLAQMPIEPVIGKCIVLGTALGIGALMCDIAASMSFSTPFVPRERHHTRMNSQQRSFAGNKPSDHVAMVAVVQAYRNLIEEQYSSDAERSFCDRYSLSPTILKMTNGARRQLVEVLANACNFPKDLLFDIHVDVNQKSGELDLMRSLLVNALYPNICYFRGKRKVYTIDQSSALVTNYSILTPFKDSGDLELPSPLLVFKEKLRTRFISCKELSVISAVQLMLFGSRKVECIGKDLIRLDDMITLSMETDLAANVMALRPCVDSLLVRACENPESIEFAAPEDQTLRDLLRDLSAEELMTKASVKDVLLTDAAQEKGFGSMRVPRGAGAHNSWGFGGGPRPNNSFMNSAGDGWNNGAGGKTPSPSRFPAQHPHPYGGGGGRGGFRGGMRQDSGFRGGNQFGRPRGGGFGGSMRGFQPRNRGGFQRGRGGGGGYGNGNGGGW